LQGDLDEATMQVSSMPTGNKPQYHLKAAAVYG
jgi:hypothetical protein